MFVTVIFNNEYMDIASRKMWYLKNLLHCKDNGWILITHDYLKKHFEELQDSITDRFVEQFEMRRFSLEEMKDVEQYFVPDEVFDSIEKKKGSRTEMLEEFYNNPNKELDECLDEIFSTIKQRHQGERIDGIFNCLDHFESLRKKAEELQCPLIDYSFSALRKVHGYKQTLYFANIRSGFWGDKESYERYQCFIKEKHASVPLFTNEEIIALLGKEHTLPLLSLIKSRPKYEMGICCECFSLVPQVFKVKHYTDDDLFYECKKIFGSDRLKVRSHAAHLNEIQVDRSEVHNDPVSTILSCKRLTAVQSQILLKVLLWQRTAILPNCSLAFSYLCENDFESEKKPDLLGLNFYIFGYLIPSELMFSDEYWKWRLTNPSEAEIYKRHLDFLYNALGIVKEKVLELKGKERFRYLLEHRGCDEQLIEELLSDKVINNVNWDVVSSQFDVCSDNGIKRYWRIDIKNDDGSLTSNLCVRAERVKEVKFYPLFDVAGFAKLKEVRINGNSISLDKSMTEFKFMPKGNGCFEIMVDMANKSKLEVECCWEYKRINDYLTGMN